MRRHKIREWGLRVRGIAPTSLLLLSNGALQLVITELQVQLLFFHNIPELLMIIISLLYSLTWQVLWESFEQN